MKSFAANELFLQAIAELQERYRQFLAERDWEKFHSPKNLAAALSVEASELLEVFMWLNDSQMASLKPDRLQNAKDEMGDVFLYLIRLADVLHIDLLEVARQKFEKVIEKYSIEKARIFTQSIEG